jgi:hypothetical protein
MESNCRAARPPGSPPPSTATGSGVDGTQYVFLFIGDFGEKNYDWQ